MEGWRITDTMVFTPNYTLLDKPTLKAHEVVLSLTFPERLFQRFSTSFRCIQMGKTKRSNFLLDMPPYCQWSLLIPIFSDFIFPVATRYYLLPWRPAVSLPMSPSHPCHFKRNRVVLHYLQNAWHLINSERQNVPGRCWCNRSWKSRLQQESDKDSPTTLVL